MTNEEDWLTRESDMAVAVGVFREYPYFLDDLLVSLDECDEMLLTGDETSELIAPKWIDELSLRLMEHRGDPHHLIPSVRALKAIVKGCVEQSLLTKEQGRVLGAMFMAFFHGAGCQFAH